MITMLASYNFHYVEIDIRNPSKRLTDVTQASYSITNGDVVFK